MTVDYIPKVIAMENGKEHVETRLLASFPIPSYAFCKNNVSETEVYDGKPVVDITDIDFRNNTFQQNTVLGISVQLFKKYHIIGERNFSFQFADDNSYLDKYVFKRRRKICPSRTVTYFVNFTKL